MADCPALECNCEFSISPEAHELKKCHVLPYLHTEIPPCSSNAGKYFQAILNRFYYGMSNYGSENIESSQKAEEWGRRGQDPNHFRPPGLPEKY
ncbi:Serum amyloid A-4 protein [Fukomys damarensis]|uniref:Serum amyloid A-4 protein n=1 Tax=Fukomys damarensis TaxID=885580 RepID=A0A091CLH8_FUKDA|nr:Serum amyloid A-4 protein [Fukomys damarensis]